MGYTPENNPYIPGDPYSYDLAWMVTEVKKAQAIVPQAEAARDVAINKAAESLASSLESEAWAIGTKDGDPVTSDDPQYENNSKYWADESADSASAAADSANDAADDAADAHADMLTAKNYADHIADPVSGLVTSWLTDHITNPSSPPVDTSLSVGGAAADAEVTGQRLSYVEDKIGSAAVELYYDDWTSDDLYTEADIFRNFGSPWKSTDYIRCLGVDTIYYKATVFHGATPNYQLAYVAFFDSDKNIISYLRSTDYPINYNTEIEGSTSVPSNAYYVRVCGKTSDCYVRFSASGMQAEIDELNAAEVSNLNGIFIGDSLTRGVINSSVDIIKESYPYWVGKILSSEVHNCGYPGGQPQTWWARKHLYDQPDPTTDIALIMFGTNGGLDVNTLATDVEPYSDYNDYADTGCGCMCKIIEWIMEETSNHAQIILLTPPMNWLNSGTEAQKQAKFNTAMNTVPVMYAIAQRYGLPVIDVFYECGMNKFNGTEFRPDDGLHFSATGYHKLGSFIAHKIASMYSTFTIGETGTILP